MWCRCVHNNRVYRQQSLQKKKHLEPDTIGAQLSTKAHCVAMFYQDIIFRRHAEEKLDPKDQPISTETKKTNQDHPGFIHHPSGLVIKKKHPGQSEFTKMISYFI